MDLKESINKIWFKLKSYEFRELIGIILFAGGIVCIALSIHAMKKISEAKDFAHSFTNFFEHNPTWNPIIKFFGGKVQEKISENYTPATLVMVAGILLIIIGTFIFVYYRLKKSNYKS